MKVLVTGGAVFIGSNLVKKLAQDNKVDKVLVLDLITYAGNLRNLDGIDPNKLKLIIGDVSNGQLMENVVEEADFIFHLAAETHVTRSIYDNHQFFHTDVMGTQAICNAALKYSTRRSTDIPFIHISTSEVYGTAEFNLMDEYHPLNPCSPYAAAKAGADRLVYSYGRTYGLNSLIIRPFNQFGPHQHPEKLIPRFITNCMSQDPMIIHGNGDASRDWTHVEDTTNWLKDLIHKDISQFQAEVFNIGAGKSHSIKEISELVKPFFLNSTTDAVAERPGQVSRHTCDSSKAKKLLDWNPKLDLESSIESVIDWYKQNTHVWETQLLTKNVEIEITPGKKIFH